MEDAKLPLPQAIRRYWVNLLVAPLSVPLSLLALSTLGQDFGMLMFVVAFLATSTVFMWPLLARRVRQSYYWFVGGLWMAGVFLVYPIAWTLHLLHAL